MLAWGFIVSGQGARLLLVDLTEEHETMSKLFERFEKEVATLRDQTEKELRDATKQNVSVSEGYARATLVADRLMPNQPYRGVYQQYKPGGPVILA